MTSFTIGNRVVGAGQPTYFIADISANHDGSLSRAKDLIRLAKRAGADCAKFQHFRADHIVSKAGFAKEGKRAHQAGWKEDVYSAFYRLSVPWDWTPELKATCDEVGIEFMSTPYDLEAVDHLDPYVNAYKIGSGDITYKQLIKHVVSKNKPIFIACGAARLADVMRAMEWLSTNKMPSICLMQCNTNYTGSSSNYRFLNLRVLKEFNYLWPSIVLGLSDHTIHPYAMLGAVTLGVRVVEKHFTDSPARSGPDHGFSLDPEEWQEMVIGTRLLEAALGDGVKKVEDNEKETVVLQRRAIRASRDLAAGTVLTADDLVMLRPCPLDALPPYKSSTLIDKTLTVEIPAGECLRASDVNG